MARRFRSPRYREDAASAYRMLVAEYPSSRLGDDALWAAVEVAREAADRRRLADSARAYLDTYPEGQRASQVKALLREREPATPLPSPPPPGLARVFDLRAWSGDSSTRVVIDVERKVQLQSDRATNPDRLWVDLLGTRLHPNLARRVFPVGDGLLEQVRIAQNRTTSCGWCSTSRTSGSTRSSSSTTRPASSSTSAGRPAPSPQVAQAPPSIPTRRVNGMVPSDTTGDSTGRPAAPIAIAGVDRLPGSRPAPPPAARAGAPPPPAAAARADPRPRAPGHEPRRLLQPRPPARPRRPAHRDRRRARRPRPRDHRARRPAGEGARPGRRAPPRAPRAPGPRRRRDPHPLHGRLHPSRGAHRHRELARRRPLPLDPRQLEPQRQRGRDRDLLPQLRPEPPRRGRRGPRERDLAGDPQGPPEPRQGHHPQQQDRREPGLRRRRPGAHGRRGSPAARGPRPGGPHRPVLRPHRRQHAGRPRRDRLRVEPRGREAAQGRRVPRGPGSKPPQRREVLPRGARTAPR